MVFPNWEDTVASKALRNSCEQIKDKLMGKPPRQPPLKLEEAMLLTKHAFKREKPKRKFPVPLEKRETLKLPKNYSVTSKILRHHILLNHHMKLVKLLTRNLTCKDRKRSAPAPRVDCMLFCNMECKHTDHLPIAEPLRKKFKTTLLNDKEVSSSHPYQLTKVAMPSRVLDENTVHLMIHKGIITVMAQIGFDGTHAQVTQVLIDVVKEVLRKIAILCHTLSQKDVASGKMFYRNVLNKSLKSLNLTGLDCVIDYFSSSLESERNRALKRSEDAYLEYMHHYESLIIAGGEAAGGVSPYAELLRYRENLRRIDQLKNSIPESLQETMEQFEKDGFELIPLENAIIHPPNLALQRVDIPETLEVPTLIIPESMAGSTIADEAALVRRLGTVKNVFIMRRKDNAPAMQPCISELHSVFGFEERALAIERSVKLNKLNEVIIVLNDAIRQKYLMLHGTPPPSEDGYVVRPPFAGSIYHHVMSLLNKFFDVVPIREVIVNKDSLKALRTDAPPNLDLPPLISVDYTQAPPSRRPAVEYEIVSKLGSLSNAFILKRRAPSNIHAASGSGNRQVNEPNPKMDIPITSSDYPQLEGWLFQLGICMIEVAGIQSRIRAQIIKSAREKLLAEQMLQAQQTQGGQHSQEGAAGPSSKAS